MLSTAIKKKPLSSHEFDAILTNGSRLKSPEECLADLVSGQSVLVPDDRHRLLQIARDYYSDTVDRIVTRADETTTDTFRVLGFQPHQFHDGIEWEKDFVSGIHWAKNYYLAVPLVMWHNKSDLKVPWELSRGHYLVWLAQAWKFTDDDRYVRKFVELIDDWTESNSYPYGINWTCAMEVAIRMLNWIAAFEIIKDNDVLDLDFTRRFYRHVYQHAVYIEENIEVIGNGLNSNHYLTDLLGLIVAGNLFRGTDRGDKWRKFAVDELEKEIMLQTLPDGFCFESSMNYQLLTSEIYLLAYLVESKFNGFSEGYRNRLKKMFELIWVFLKPDGSIPNFGDGDSGRILVFNGVDRPDPQRLLDIGALILDMPHLRSHSKKPPFDSVWLAGAEIMETLRSTADAPRQQRESHYYSDSGLATLREDDLYLFLAANPIGSGGIGGHKHNDMLTIEISCGNTNFIVDSGTYRYTSNQADRDRFRSTAYHSVPAINEEEQNRFLPKLLFAIRPDAKVKVNRWESNDDFDLIEAEHSAYSRLPDPIHVLRSVYFDKPHGLWIIKDDFYGGGEFDFADRLILGDVEPRVVDSSHISLESRIEERRLDIVIFSREWDFEIVTHEVSPLYGMKCNAERIDFSLTGNAPASMVWAAIPMRSSGELSRKRRVAQQIIADMKWMDGTAESSQKLTLKHTHA